MKTELDPLEHYRLLCTVLLKESSMVEFHFGVLSDRALDPPRLIMRITPTEIQFGDRAGEQQPFVVTERVASHHGNNDPIPVVIERQRNEWRIFVDSQLMHSIPHRGERIRHQFSILVADGPAWFANVGVEELVEPVAPAQDE